MYTVYKTTQNGRRGYCAKFIQLIQSVWTEKKVAPVHNIPARLSAHTYRLDQLFVFGAISFFPFRFFIQFKIIYNIVKSTFDVDDVDLVDVDLEINKCKLNVYLLSLPIRAGHSLFFSGSLSALRSFFYQGSLSL